MTRSREAKTDTFQTIIAGLNKRIDNLERSPMNLLNVVKDGTPLYGVLPTSPNYTLAAGSKLSVVGASNTVVVEFDQPFLNGLMTVVAWAGSAASSPNYTMHGLGSTNTSNTMFGFQLVGASLGSNVLVNYIAVGW